MNEMSLEEAVRKEAESARAALTAFVRSLADEEFDWRPDDGIPSAREILGGLMQDEARRRDAAAGGRRRSGRIPPVPSSPVAASDWLRAERAVTLEAIASAGSPLGTSMLPLLLNDLRAMAGIVFLQRLIDPSRVLPV